MFDPSSSFVSDMGDPQNQSFWQRYQNQQYTPDQSWSSGQNPQKKKGPLQSFLGAMGGGGGTAGTIGKIGAFLL